MKAARAFTLCIALAAAMAAGSLLSIPAAVAAPEQKIGPQVGKPLSAAQEAMKKKDWDAALARIKEAQAIEKKTPYEEYQINEFLSYVYLQQKNYADAEKVYEATLDSGFLTPEQVDERLKVLAQLNLQLQSYDKAAQYLTRYLKTHPDDMQLQSALAQSYYVQKDYKDSITAMQPVIAAAEKGGGKPDENSLKIVLSANVNLKDDAGIKSSLEDLVRYYPKPEYWKGLLSTLLHSQHTDRQTLGVYRLMLDTDTIEQPNDYVEMAQLAIQAGLPGEAQKVLEKGFAAKVLGNSDKEHQQHLLSQAQQQAQTDKAGLPKLEKEASTSSSGQADVALGLGYLSYDQYDQAIAAIEHGLKKGHVTDVDDTEINLGIAYLRKGQNEQALAAFKSVKADSSWAPLARLWVLRAGGTA